MRNKWNQVIEGFNGKTIYHVLKLIENKYPESTRNSLYEGNREVNGYPTDNISGYKHDKFVAAVKHCASWMILRGVFPVTRFHFNMEYSAKDLADIVSQWLNRTPRFKDMGIAIPAMAWIAAAWIFDLEESNHDYPYYKISRRTITRN